VLLKLEEPGRLEMGSLREAGCSPKECDALSEEKKLPNEGTGVESVWGRRMSKDVLIQEYCSEGDRCRTQTKRERSAWFIGGPKKTHRVEVVVVPGGACKVAGVSKPNVADVYLKLVPDEARGCWGRPRREGCWLVGGD